MVPEDLVLPVPQSVREVLLVRLDLVVQNDLLLRAGPRVQASRQSQLVQGGQGDQAGREAVGKLERRSLNLE